MNEQKFYKILSDYIRGRKVNQSDINAIEALLQNPVTENEIAMAHLWGNKDSVMASNDAEAYAKEMDKYARGKSNFYEDLQRKGSRAEAISNIIGAGADSILAQAQQKQAQRQLENLPSLSSLSDVQYSPERQAELSRQQQLAGNIYNSPEARLASQRVDDAYKSALLNARSSSGGQASNFGAMAQAASLGRGRLGLESDARLGAAARQERDRLSRLLSDKQRFDINNQARLDRRFYDQRDRRDLLEKRAGELGALGLQNSMQARRNFGKGMGRFYQTEAFNGQEPLFKSTSPNIVDDLEAIKDQVNNDYINSFNRNNLGYDPYGYYG